MLKWLRRPDRNEPAPRSAPRPRSSRPAGDEPLAVTRDDLPWLEDLFGVEVREHDRPTSPDRVATLGQRVWEQFVYARPEAVAFPSLAARIVGIAEQREPDLN